MKKKVDILDQHAHMMQTYGVFGSSQKELDVDLIITHPMGVSEYMKLQLIDAVHKKAEELGCTVGGSFTLVDVI